MMMQAYFWQVTLSTSLQNVWPPSWILKAHEGWGEKEISAKGVVDRQEEGGGRGRGKKNTCLLIPTTNYR